MRNIKLVDQLFSEVQECDRCPHLRRDKQGPYCTNGLKGDEISKVRRYVCDTFSLQFWCLDKDHYRKCIFYNGEPLD